MKLKLLTLSLLITTSLIAKEDMDSNTSATPAQGNPFLKTLIAQTGAVVTAYTEEEKRLDEEIAKGKAEEKRLDAQIAQIEKEIAELSRKYNDNLEKILKYDNEIARNEKTINQNKQTINQNQKTINQNQKTIKEQEELIRQKDKLIKMLEQIKKK